MRSSLQFTYSSGVEDPCQTEAHSFENASSTSSTIQTKTSSDVTLNSTGLVWMLLVEWMYSGECVNVAMEVPASPVH